MMKIEIVQFKKKQYKLALCTSKRMLATNQHPPLAHRTDPRRSLGVPRRAASRASPTHVCSGLHVGPALRARPDGRVALITCAQASVRCRSLHAQSTNCNVRLHSFAQSFSYNLRMINYNSLLPLVTWELKSTLQRK